MIYVTSDLHGYPLEKFLKLLKRAAFSDSDFCFILGDIIDRGEESVELLKWVMVQPNVELLLGNHEAMMLSNEFLFSEVTEKSIDQLDKEQMELFSAWMENGGVKTLNALAKCDDQTVKMIFDYLKEVPIYETLTVNGKKFFLSHSGLANFQKDKPLEEYDLDAFIWNRPYADDEYFDDVISVFGHTPTGLFGNEYRGKILKTRTWIDVDTGTASGIPPALLRLDDLQEIY